MSAAARANAGHRAAMAVADNGERRLQGAYARALRAIGRDAERKARDGSLVAAVDPDHVKAVADAQARVAAATTLTAQQVAAAVAAVHTSLDVVGLVTPWLERFLGSQAERLVSGSQAEVRSIVLEGQREGWSVDQVADEIRSRFSELARWRARMLARTDLVGLANGVSYLSAERSGAPLWKEWLNSADERVRPTHVDAGGQRVPLATPFAVGEASLAYPGDPRGPDGEVINCRCTLIYFDGPAVTAASPPSGASMLALRPTAEQAGALAVDGGEKPEDIHLTLVYFPEPVDVAAVERAAAGAWPPMEGTVTAVTAFPEGKNGHPVVAVPSVVGLNELRADLVEALDREGVVYSTEHGFVPHLTLAYGEAGLAGDLADRVGLGVSFDRLLYEVAGEDGPAVVVPLTAAGWDESRVERHPEGTKVGPSGEGGGRFKSRLFSPKVTVPQGPGGGRFRSASLSTYDGEWFPPDREYIFQTWEVGEDPIAARDAPFYKFLYGIGPNGPELKLWTSGDVEGSPHHDDVRAYLRATGHESREVYFGAGFAEGPGGDPTPVEGYPMLEPDELLELATQYPIPDEEEIYDVVGEAVRRHTPRMAREREALAAAAWDESKVARHPRGTSQGGQFREKDGIVTGRNEIGEFDANHWPEGEWDPDGRVVFWPQRIMGYSGFRQSVEGPLWKAFLDKKTGQTAAFWFVSDMGYPHHEDVNDRLGNPARTWSSSELDWAQNWVRVSGYGKTMDHVDIPRELHMSLSEGTPEQYERMEEFRAQAADIPREYAREIREAAEQLEWQEGPVTAAGFDESKVRRWPEGTPVAGPVGGGRFAPEGVPDISLLLERGDEYWTEGESEFFDLLKKGQWTDEEVRRLRVLLRGELLSGFWLSSERAQYMGSFAPVRKQARSLLRYLDPDTHRKLREMAEFPELQAWIAEEALRDGTAGEMTTGVLNSWYTMSPQMKDGLREWLGYELEQGGPLSAQAVKDLSSALARAQYFEENVARAGRLAQVREEALALVRLLEPEEAKVRLPKIDPRSQGIPDVYLTDRGTFKPGFDAKLKTDLVHSALEKPNWDYRTRTDKRLHVFDPTEARRILEERGWEEQLFKAEQREGVIRRLGPEGSTLPADADADLRRVYGLMGGALDVRGVEYNQVQNHLKSLAQFPDHVLKGASDRGVGVFIGIGKTPDLDGLIDIHDEHPPGWTGGSSWKRVPGAYSRGPKVAVIGTEDSGRVLGNNLAAHEFGHAIGHVYGVDGSPELLQWKAKLKPHLVNYAKQPRDVDGREFWAMGTQFYAERKIAQTEKRKVWDTGPFTRSAIVENGETNVTLIPDAEAFMEWLSRKIETLEP